MLRARCDEGVDVLCPATGLYGRVVSIATAPVDTRLAQSDGTPFVSGPRMSGPVRCAEVSAHWPVYAGRRPLETSGQLRCPSALHSVRYVSVLVDGSLRN